MHSAFTCGWWFPWKSQHSIKQISSIFLANNAQSLKQRIKLSSSKKTFGNVGISALLSFEDSHWYSRNINCCPPSNWTREQITYHWAEFGILSVKIIGEDLKRLPEQRVCENEIYYQDDRSQWPLSWRNKRFVAGTSLIKIEWQPERKSANFRKPQ